MFPKMKLMSLKFLVLLQVVVLPMIHGRVYFPMDAILIDQTCKQTPNYDLCVSSLQSDPRSPSADIKELGVIMVDAVKGKVTDTLNKINQLLQQSPGDQALSSCLSLYDGVLRADIPQASEAFTQGVPKVAEQGMNDVAAQADSCESGFPSSSPLIDKNKAVLDVAAVAAAIARI